MLPAAVARELCVLPVRIAGDVLIVATALEDTTLLEAELAKRLPIKVMFVRVDGGQLAEMIDTYYPARLAG
jgi:hypothetical protein